MPAFKDAQRDAIRRALYDLYDGVVSRRVSGLTQADAKELIVSPLHYTLVEEARTILGMGSGGSVTLSLPEVCGATIDLDLVVSRDYPGFPFPGYAGGAILADPESEPHKRLTMWAKWRTRVAGDWALTNSVFSALNRRCKTPAQVRYFWPTILTFMELSDDEKLAGMADKLRPYKAPNDLPRIERELAESARKASGIVSKALLQRDAPPVRNEQVNLSLSSYVPPRKPWDLGTSCAVPVRPA